MKIGTSLKAHPWLFAGLAALPSGLLIALLACLIIFGHHSERAPSIVPLWLECLGAASLPVFVTLIGFVLAFCLSCLLDKYRLLIIRPRTHIYLAVFTFMWNLVFGYLSFFVFAMGFGDGPAPTSIEEYMHRLIGIVSYGYLEAALISLVICSIFTAIIVAVTEAIIEFSKLPRL